MTKSTSPRAGAGRRRAAEGPSGPSPTLVLGGMAIGLLAAAAAWVALVLWAIGLGRDARADGSASDWVLMVVVSIAAMACLGLLLWLGSQLLKLLGVRRPRRR